MGKYNNILCQVAKLLENSNWLLGGSGSLYVQGVKIVPADIDIVVNHVDHKKISDLLNMAFTPIKTEDPNCSATKYMLDGIGIEILQHNFDRSELTMMEFRCSDCPDTLQIPVYPLSRELQFYEARTDKLEKNKEKMRLIKEALARK